MYSLIYLFLCMDIYILYTCINNILFKQTKKIFIMRGLPGSGKSEWINDYIVKHNTPVNVCNYQIFKNKDPKISIPQAYSLCFKLFIKYLKHNEKLIFIDNPNIEMWEYENYKILGDIYGYTINIIEINCPNNNYIPIFYERNTNNTSLKQIERFYKRWEVDSKGYMIEPYIDFSENGDSLPYPKKTLKQLDIELNEIAYDIKKKKE